VSEEGEAYEKHAGVFKNKGAADPLQWASGTFFIPLLMVREAPV